MFLTKEKEQELIEKVRLNPFFLEHIETQTEEMCLEAVKKNGTALRYVENQAPEICLEAVKQNGYALEYVNEQTTEICLAAVRQDGNALEYVKEQTPKLCFEAVKRTGKALEYVKNKTPKIYSEAVKEDPFVLQVIIHQVMEDCLTALYGHQDFGSEDIPSYYFNVDDLEFYDFIKSPTKEMERIYDILKVDHTNYLKSYRRIRYRLANEEIDLKDSTYHVLDCMYRY